MNRGLFIFFFSLAVSTGVSLQSSVSIDSQINTRNITSFTIANGQNLTNFYESQRRFLKTIASEQMIYMQNIFDKKHSEHKELIDDLKLKNMTKCTQYSHSKIKDSLVIALEENDKCFMSQESILVNSVNSKLREIDVQLAFPACFKVELNTDIKLHCIDQHVMAHVEDKSIKKVYNNTLVFLKNLEDTTFASLNRCIKEFGNILNFSILYVTAEFHICVEQQAVAQIATNIEKKSNHSLDTKNSNIEKKFTSLYKTHTQMLEIIESRHQQSIRVYKNNLIDHYHEVIKSADIRKRNITCCLHFPKIIISEATGNALNKSDECFRNHWTTFNKFINSTIQNIELGTSRQICQKENLSQLMILDCYDQTILQTLPIVKNTYEKAKSSVKKYTDEFSLNKYQCLKDSIDIFNRSLQYSNVLFDSCLKIQEYGEECIILTLNKFDYKRLLDLNLISPAFYKIITNEMNISVIPRVG